MAVRRVREYRILDFDIENRPLTYAGSDFTFAEITAIAAGWVGQSKVHCWLLGDCDAEDMLEGFCRLYRQADMVTGHNIRKHDLPKVNGSLLEYGMRPLEPKLSQDTYGDLHKLGAVVSKSQEALSALFGVEAPKVGMNQQMWRQANRLEPAGLKLTRARVVGDVRQHQQLREALINAGYLKAPKVWRP